MIKKTSVSGDIMYDVEEYVVDTVEELPNIPSSCAMGSTAIVISTAEVYMKNGSGEWIKL